MNTIVVSKDGKVVTAFSSFKKVSDANGWDKSKYNRLRSNGFPQDIDGYTFTKVPDGISLSCFELVTTAQAKDSATNHDGSGLVTIAAYDREYEVEFDTETVNVDAEEITTPERGTETVAAAYSYQKPLGVISAAEITEDGHKYFEVDKWSENQLLDLIDLKE